MNQLMSSGSTVAQAWMKSMTGCTVATKQQVKECLKNKKSLSSLIPELEKSSASAKISSIALKGLAFAGNMAAMAIGSFVITSFVKVMDTIISKSEEARQKTEELVSSYKTFSENTKEEANKIKELSPRYEELSKGVNNLGENISLTSSEYSEYNSICNQIADMFPSLIQGYTDEGNAILNLKGNVEALTEAYRQKRKEEAASIIAGSDNSVSTNYNSLNRVDFGTMLKMMKDPRNSILGSLIGGWYDTLLGDSTNSRAKTASNTISTNTISLLKSNLSMLGAGMDKQLEDAMSTKAKLEVLKKALNMSMSDLKTSSTDNDILGIMLRNYGLDEESTDSEMKSIIANMRADLATYQASFETGLSGWKSLASSYFLNEDDYDVLSDSQISAVNTLINSIDSTIADKFNNGDSSAQVYVSNIIDGIKNNKDGVADAYSSLFEIDPNNMENISSSKEQIDKYIKIIADYIGTDTDSLKKNLGYDIADDIVQSYNNAIRNASTKFSGQNFIVNGGSPLYDAQKSDLEKFFEENSINTQEEIDRWIEIANECDNATDAKKRYLQQKISDETSNSFVKSMTEVEKSKTGFDLIDKIYADVKNKEEFDWTSILNNTSFTETFGNMENVTEEYKSVYDEFIETVSNSPSDIDKCQKAFNRLTTAYLQNEGTLSAITDQSKEAAILYLQEQGVVNATEVVYASLLKTKLESEEASIAVANGTASEINSLLTEGVVTEETAQKLAAYALYKSLVNTETIDTAADCENVMRLAKVAGASVDALSQLDALKQRLADNPIMSEEMRKTITNKIKSIVSDVESSAVVSIDIPEVDYKGGSTTQKAADSAKKTADDLYNDLKEQIDAYMDYMEKSLDAGKIDYNTYCSSVKNYLDDLYNSGKLKAKDYFDYTEKMLNKQKDIYDKVISAVVDRLEEEVDKWQEKIDELESVNDKLKDNLSNMDSALDAIDRVYDKEIDRIQAIIDGLKDANDERDRTLALEKAKYELEKAYSQKIKKLYVEGKGYIYTPDYDAIKDAQSSYDDAELDLKTSELQKQIDTLTDFKSKWDDVKNAYQYNIDKMNATALLGSEYQKLILNNNILDIENFKNQYVGIQQQINSNEELIKSYNEKVDYYNKLKEQWQSITDEYDKQRNAQYASQVLGANWENDVLNGRLSTWNNFRNQYVSLQQAIADAQVQSANAQIKALQALADAAQASANAQIEAAQRVRREEIDNSSHSIGDAVNIDGMISAGAPTSVINKITGNKSNTSAAATSDQRKNNSNIIMSNEQKKTIAASKKRANNIRKYANGGVVKINPDDLLTGLAKQHGEDGFAMVQDGERILTQQQTASFDRFVDLITGMNVTPQMLMPDFMKAAQTVTNNNRPNYSVNMGDVVLNGVQNTKDFGAALMKYIPGEFGRQLCGRTR
mgnify:CR=1 FL=1|nr:MAG TPA: hypothetical protein [Caudoviricetes sp.]